MNQSAPIPDICARVRQVREVHAGPRGKARFARALGLSPSTYDYYEHARVPPADVLVRMADLAGADLRWLITGARGEPALAAHQPVLARAAELLSDRPEAVGALAAFLDLLGEAARKFPTWPAGQAVSPASPAGALLGGDGAGGQAPPMSAEAPESPGQSVRSSAEAAPAQAFGDSGGGQFGIPILGRSAAGVVAFWPQADGAEGVTELAHLVARLPTQRPRQIQPAELRRDADRFTARIVRYDRPQASGTSEFIQADALADLPGPLFAVRLDGQSMEPDLRHGDLVVLSPACPAEQGKPAVVQLAGQIGVTCKLLRRDGDTVHLVPVNDQFAPTRHEAAQLAWALRVLACVRPG